MKTQSPEHGYDQPEGGRSQGPERTDGTPAIQENGKKVDNKTKKTGKTPYKNTRKRGKSRRKRSISTIHSNGLITKGSAGFGCAQKNRGKNGLQYVNKAITPSGKRGGFPLTK